MLFLWASLPLLLVVPSLRIRTGCPEPVVVKYAIFYHPTLIELYCLSRIIAKIKQEYKLFTLSPFVLFIDVQLVGKVRVVFP